MKFTLQLLLSFTIAFSTLQSFAVIDMKNANYSDTWVDLIAPGTGYDLRVRRTYNSRSLFDGMFGFGWCSDFETSLDINAEGNIKLTECGSGLEITYTSKNFNGKVVQNSINKIITSHKKSKPGLGKGFYKNFQTRLKGNSNLRTHYANLYKISTPAQEGTTFFANGREIERVVLKKGVYIRYLTDNTLQKFNKEGKLIYLSDRNSNHLKFNRNNKSQLKEIVDNNGRKLSFKYFESKKIKSITGPNGLKVSYKFKNEDIISVNNAWKKTYTYEYDDLHNLTKISFPNKTTKKLTYNKDRDWVTSFKNRKNCLETYKYASKSGSKDNYTSSVVKKCQGKVMVKSSYEFWHKVRPDGVKYLARVKTVFNDDTTDITYHPTFGRPVRSGKNGVFTKYSYYKNGLVKTKLYKKEKTSFEYKNNFRKVSKVTFLKLNKKGKVNKKEITAFKYDGKGNLSFAKNSFGQTVKLTYDSNGRIATIKDHAKKLVKISYDKKFGKPSYVQRPGLGAITISYKPSGEIKQVKSKDGPSVAVQVASTFNNLLDIISPATDELSL